MCYTPYITTDKKGNTVACPCGHCLQCLQDFQKQWTFRLTQECKQCVSPIFITLTHNDDSLPVFVNDDGIEESCVFKFVFQNFMKRLRRYFPDIMRNGRYFAIGEYGSKKNRAHYHAVLMLPNLRLSKRDCRKFNDAVIQKAWTLGGESLGYSKVEIAQEKQIQYVCKYLNKLDKRPHMASPFRLMSKSIGLNFLSSAMVNYYLTTFDRTCVNGKARIALPRYYRKKLDELSERVYMMKRAGVVYSELIEKPEFNDGSLRSLVYNIQQDFCHNFAEYYRKCVAHYAHLSREHGFEFHEPNRNEVYQFIVRSNHELQDAIRHSKDVLDKTCIKNLNPYIPVSDELDEYS